MFAYKIGVDSLLFNYWKTILRSIKIITKNLAETWNNNVFSICWINIGCIHSFNYPVTDEFLLCGVESVRRVRWILVAMQESMKELILFEINILSPLDERKNYLFCSYLELIAAMRLFQTFLNFNLIWDWPTASIITWCKTLRFC